MTEPVVLECSWEPKPNWRAVITDLNGKTLGLFAGSLITREQARVLFGLDPDTLGETT